MNSEAKAIKTLRQLSLEEIDIANSGHPGIALGAAPIIHTLFSRHLKATSKNSKWINRDRFVLAAGHGSSLLYAMLHLCGYHITIEDLKKFRSLDSITPGHPEVGLTDGVDASSGPLGQGIAVGVGMAISEAHLASILNNEEVKLINHYTYVLCGDGDLQEGVTQEAMSLAGTLGLNKLIVLYDSNDIQLDGEVNKCNSENTKAKYESMNWNYLLVSDGENVEEISEAITAAKESTDKPTIIEIKTTIGYSSTLAGKAKVHGSPLPHDEVLALRYELGGEAFSVDKDVYEFYYEWNIRRNQKEYSDYEEVLNKASNQGLYAKYRQMLTNDYPVNVEELLKINNEEAVATRTSNGEAIKKISSVNLSLIGGSSDVASSTKIKGIDGDFTKENPSGRNILFGVREFAMATICNGIALHGMLRPFCGCFLVFSDYLKPAIRMAALMHLPVIYMFTHDSIAVGEDGATHEPVEQITMLRSIPSVNVIRPADSYELRESWNVILKTTDKPTVLILTRQNVNQVSYPELVENLKYGAYIARYETDELTGIIMASGSELELAIKVCDYLKDQGKGIRIISIPSPNIFDEQTEVYKKKLIPDHITNIMAIEMDDATHLYKYVGRFGSLVNINTFGVSGKASLVIEKYNFTVSEIAKKYFEMMNKNK